MLMLEAKPNISRAIRQVASSVGRWALRAKL